MEKTIRLLVIVLAAQLLLAAGILLAGRGGDGDTAASAPLIAFEAGSVDRIVITGPDEAQVVLTRGDGRWRVPASGSDFPAAESRVSALLERLGALRRGAAVATTSGARERFEVAGDDFERRIVLEAGGEEVGRLYVGSSPVMRRAHARAGGEDEVYLVEFAAYEAPASATDWQDKDLLRIPAEQIVAIEVNGLRIERPAPVAPTGDSEAAADPAVSWRAPTLGEDEVLREDAAARLASLIAGLRIGDVLGRKEEPHFGLDQPALVLRVELRDDETREYRLGRDESGDGYVLKASSRPEYFGLASFAADPILEAAGRDALIR